MQKAAEGAAIATQRNAEASAIAVQKAAEASNFATRQRAEGITALADAYGAMAQVFGGPDGLLQYLMLEQNTYEKLALANAKALNGLQPKISVWNTGNQSEGSGAGAGGAIAPIRDLLMSLPPLLSTVQEQTGIKPPSWLARMPEEGAANKVEGGKERGLSVKTNGTK